jgi:hypothetical protein
MQDELSDFDENSYLVLFPVGMVCQVVRQLEDGRMHFDGILTAEIDGQQCLPLFTDDDSAERFLRDNGLRIKATIAWFHKPAELADYLEGLGKDDGYECVAFDPVKQKGRPILTNQAVAKLRRMESQS